MNTSPNPLRPSDNESFTDGTSVARAFHIALAREGCMELESAQTTPAAAGNGGLALDLGASDAVADSPNAAISIEDGKGGAAVPRLNLDAPYDTDDGSSTSKSNSHVTRSDSFSSHGDFSRHSSTRLGKGAFGAVYSIPLPESSFDASAWSAPLFPTNPST
eukprot:CAMPEP_0174840736 /NCGR_PEP_ID=MMETSP1114-20130205/8867_1 /TAXON_ID=312471 /ORGANISM="Neobodo designis, Strain CCAP 1951/1" /LENGTH=160 /DNA_ID=CAMNT_0016074899 /DNA_START=146 /DNA_END=624 /DNA_ORIENTATION=+